MNPHPTFNNGMPSTAWVEVDVAALRSNFAVLAKQIVREDKSVGIIAVVKANGYGHGICEAATVFSEAGAWMVAVSTAEESVKVRTELASVPILQFLPALPEQLEWLLQNGITLTATSDHDVAAITRAAQQLNVQPGVHLKVDTGMGRLGVLPDSALALAREIADNKHIRFAGIYTHCARATDNDARHTRRQFEAFSRVVGEIKGAGIDCGVCHFSNSASALRFPDYHFDAVRLGTVLYGQAYAGAGATNLDLKSTWTLRARVLSVRSVPSGTSVGYGAEFTTKRASRLAVLGIGFADGLSVIPESGVRGTRGIRHLVSLMLGRENGLTVRFDGVSAKIVGRVGMQTCVVDVTHLPVVEVGSVATLASRRITTPEHLQRVYKERASVI